MRGMLTAGLMICVFLAIPTAGAADTLREARWATVEPAQALPADLTAPEGKSRWDLTSIETGQTWLRSLVAEPDGAGIRRMDQVLEEGTEQLDVVLFGDRDLGRSAERWLLPDRDSTLLSPERSERYLLDEVAGERIERLWIETRRVGVGWLHLPTGPREVVLQWAAIYRETADGGGFVPETVLHRWVDPREGVVAEVWGPASRDGISRLEVTRRGDRRGDALRANRCCASTPTRWIARSPRSPGLRLRPGRRRRRLGRDHRAPRHHRRPGRRHVLGLLGQHVVERGGRDRIDRRRGERRRDLQLPAVRFQSSRRQAGPRGQELRRSRQRSTSPPRCRSGRTGRPTSRSGCAPA